MLDRKCKLLYNNYRKGRKKVINMKAIKEVTVTREEIEMIESFFEVCEKYDLDFCDRFAFLEAIVNEDREFFGIDIIIKG